MHRIYIVGHIILKKLLSKNSEWYLYWNSKTTNPKNKNRPYLKFIWLHGNVLSAGAEPKLLEGLQDVQVTASDRVPLTCQIYLGRPRAKVQWYRNDKKIFAGDKYEITTDEDGETMSLVIAEATVKDSATYRCKASNKVGKVHTECDVEVLRTFRWFIYLFIYSLIVYSFFYSFVCSSTGWRKNGATISLQIFWNSMTELRGNWWTSAILHAEHSH